MTLANRRDEDEDGDDEVTAAHHHLCHLYRVCLRIPKTEITS